jgi:hypothetical protein
MGVMKNSTRLLMSLLIGLAGPVGSSAQEVLELPDLEDPTSVAVSDDALFVTTGDHEILVYSLTPLALHCRCGGSGEGSGSFTHPPRLARLASGVLAHDFLKSMRVDKDCRLSEEIDYGDLPWFDSNMEMQLIPVEQNYVRISVDHDLQRYYVDLLSPRFERIKRLYDGSWKWTLLSQYTPNRLSTLPHYIDVRVDGDEIYVADTNRGFFLSVFDSGGRHLRSIDKTAELASLPVTDAYKRGSEERARSALEGRLPPDQQYSFAFPEYFPAIHYFHVDGGRIYAMTYSESDGKHEILVLDESGNTLRSVYLPIASANYYFPSSLPIELNMVHDGKLYEVVRNTAAERWELHISELE